jgi:beta-N-acetylhexosaminidase
MSARMAMGEMTSLEERKRRAGQRLFIGLFGHAVTDELRALVQEIRPAGFVLFARNVVEPGQVAELNRELGSLVDPHAPAIIAVDQEGGRVARIREPATVFPAMRVVGRANDLSLSEEVAAALARELRAMGFHLDFAPVADVDSNPANPIIGDRSFGPSPERVSEHVAAFVRGMQREHVIACAKHFPGHGDTLVDSHKALPVVDRPIDELRRVELPPFRAAVQAGVGTVMTSHVMFPAWDAEWPATLSPRILSPLLRDELGFRGLIFSDDMDMKAVADRWPPDVLVRQGTEACVDVFLACNEPERQVSLFEALVRLQEQSKAHEGVFVGSVARVVALRERFLAGLPPAPSLFTVGSDAHRDLVARVKERAEWSA